MSTTEFQPDRSAAIRRLLLDTVADEPKRQRRLQIMLTSVLSAIAIVLAGGAAALALTGVIRFGAGAPAPVQTSTPTVTPTPSPTPTPTPTPTATPIVQSTPITPHDVDSLPAHLRWALDLPGADTGCNMVLTYNIADGRALYLSGARPKEYEGSDCIYEKNEDIALTLVDTADGKELWTREWGFTPDQLSLETDIEVLGTSGRAVISYGNSGFGPHEVLDLATGRALGPFLPDFPGFRLRTDGIAASGPSGDLLLVRHTYDDAGEEISGDTVLRVDPLHPDVPRWSTRIDGSGVSFSTAVDGTLDVPITYYRTGEPSFASSLVDVTTGHVGAAFARAQAMSDAFVGQTYSVDEPVQVSGYDADGTKLWEQTIPPASNIFEVLSASTEPGSITRYGEVGTGTFVITDPLSSSVTLVDQRTGEKIWASSSTGCRPFSYFFPQAAFDAARNAIATGAGCEFDAMTGERLPDNGIPVDGWNRLGVRNVYGYDPATGDDGVAYDLSTGRVLWTLAREPFDEWTFDGGYLVSHRGSHIESIG